MRKKVILADVRAGPAHRGVNQNSPFRRQLGGGPVSWADRFRCRGGLPGRGLGHRPFLLPLPRGGNRCGQIVEQFVGDLGRAAAVADRLYGQDSDPSSDRCGDNVADLYSMRRLVGFYAVDADLAARTSAAAWCVF